MKRSAPPPHSIGTLRLDLALAGAAGQGLEHGRALQRHLMSFCERELDAALTPVLDDVAPGDHLVHIRKIELDLGALTLARFETEFADRLRQALRGHLWRLGLPRRGAAGAPAPAPWTPGAAAPDRSAGSADASDLLDSLSAMLRGAGGRQPALRDWDRLLHDLARRAPAALAALLRRELRDEHARRRLLRGVTAPARQRLWRWLAAPAAVARLHAALRAALAHGAQSGPLLELRQHEAALAQWLAQPSRSATTVFVQGSLQALAHACRRPYAAMLRTAELGSGGEGELASILSRLGRAQAVPRAAPAGESAPAQRLRNWLLHGVWSEPTDASLPEWLALLPEALLLQGLREAGPNAAARLARQPSEWRRPMMRLLAGPAATDLTALHQRLAGIAAGLDAEAGVVARIAEHALLESLLDGGQDGSALHAAVAEALALQLPRDYDEVLAALDAHAASARAGAAATDAVANATGTDGAAGAVRLTRSRRRAAPSWRPPATRSRSLARPARLDGETRTTPPGLAAERAQLLHWLGTGQWPWWADEQSGPAMLLRRQLASGAGGADALRAGFAQLADPGGAVRRMVRYLPPAMLEALLLQLAPALGGFTITWLKAGAMLASAPDCSLNQRRRSAATHVQVALGVVLRASGAGLSAAGFVDEAARRCAAQLGMPLQHYREVLHAAAARAAQRQARYTVLVELLHARGGTAPAPQPAKEPAQPGDPAPAPQPAKEPAQLGDTAPAPAEQALTRLLRHGIGLAAHELAALYGVGDALARAPASTALRRRWRRLLSAAAVSPLERARLSSLPPAVLTRLLPLLLPAPQLGEIQALLAALATALAPALRRRADRVVWDTLFDQWHRQRAQRWSMARFLVALAQRLHSQLGVQPVRLLNGLTATLRLGHGAHVEHTRRSVAAAVQELVAVTLPARARAPRAAREHQPAPQQGAHLPVGNAGLVLLHSFLSPYFSMLGLLAGGDFVDVGARSRAVYLLQFLASGNHDAPEHELALNKLLCGMPFSESPVFVDPPDENAIRLGLDLLHMVTQRWDKLNNTSVAGLQETFLMREGRLVIEEGKTTLHVPCKTVDILKQSFPWQHSIIMLPWLSTPLFVNWS